LRSHQATTCIPKGRSHRKSRRELLSPSKASWATTKSVGMCDFPFLHSALALCPENYPENVCVALTRAKNGRFLLTADIFVQTLVQVKSFPSNALEEMGCYRTLPPVRPIRKVMRRTPFRDSKRRSEAVCGRSRMRLRSEKPRWLASYSIGCRNWVVLSPIR
jgi:hypothetical protein